MNTIAKYWPSIIARLQAICMICTVIIFFCGIFAPSSSLLHAVCDITLPLCIFLIAEEIADGRVFRVTWERADQPRTNSYSAKD